ncbi:MAG: arginine--tRNA ligase, partial [Desulfobulbaceae bacterium]|nr:arginine--tRNA ligase [Desulfobulbaceae bacterium]
MIKKRLKARLDQCFTKGVDQGLWSADSAGTYAVEEPKQATHGDFATNMAMVIGGREKKNPREIAGQLAGLMA